MHGCRDNFHAAELAKGKQLVNVVMWENNAWVFIYYDRSPPGPV